MSDHPLDRPEIIDNLFFPRRSRPSSGSSDSTFDGMIPIEEGIILGYRLYARDKSFPVIVYFHGNGEIATDYDNIALMYHMAGASLLVIDYRGYGWSTGKPLASTLASDAEPVVNALPNLLKQAKIEPDVPLFIKGRSLGSAPAIHAAYRFPDCFKGLIVESGYALAPSLFSRPGISVDLVDDDSLPLNNIRKIESIYLPLLVIHGEKDVVLPVDNGQRLYDASPSPHKTLLRIPNAGHNNLLTVGMQDYFAAIRDFIDAHFQK